MLKELCGDIGPRLSGSINAARAVEWGAAKMNQMGFQNVHLVPCKVPHWERGTTEFAELVQNDERTNLSTCALGGSVGTPEAGITGEVIEVQSIQEVTQLGASARGKIIFFNRPFDATLTNTFGAYGGAVDQRVDGASAAAKVGAIGVLVRSMTLDHDDVPHTGTLSYSKDAGRIPAAALGLVSADRLSDALVRRALGGKRVFVHLTLDCKNLPDEASASVVGEITGSKYSDEVIVVGGHLDSWDRGRGAHDDGAGVTQSLEALRLIKELGWKPKRTIRVVLFMNEENGGRGAEAYAAAAKSSKQKHIAAIESDSGGFAPRAFSCSLPVAKAKTLSKWLASLRKFEIERIDGGGGGGADVGPLGSQGAVLFGLEPESQRYFDYHHSDKDTIDKVNPRELELGALSLAQLAWLISEQGLPR